MVKGFLKKCFEILKLVAPLTLIAFIVFGLLGFGIWAIFHYTNIIIGFIVSYVVVTIVIAIIFTYFVFDKDSYIKKDNDDNNDMPDLPFMPGNFK